MAAEVDPEAIRAAMGSCLTVVRPDEVLVVLVPGDLPDAEYTRMAEEVEAANELYGTRIVVIAGDDFVVLKAALVKGDGAGGPGGT